MTIDFEKIRKDNIEDYGKKTHHLSFLGNLYADRTHFIYELLQNAEDAKATTILFRLTKNHLEVIHDGRQFDEDDVKGICGVGDGTKSDDLTQIGTFGIGFKSVYGYTLKPEIHCGINHFCIEHYVRPHEIESKEIPTSSTTLFVFPFDREHEEMNQISPHEAFEEISDRLKKLGIRTLLFLSNLEEISFEIECGSTGSYLRENEIHNSHRQVKIIGQCDDDEVDEQWLVFSKQLPDPNQLLKTEIAFKVGNSDGNEQEIKRIASSHLTVYFPTEQETHLGFLVQGPFQTTPARDNIPRYNEWNKNLVLEIRDLLSQTLHDIKELGLLSVSFLESLPIRDVLPHDEWLIRPLYDITKEVLTTHKLLPTDDGRYVKADNAVLSRTADIRTLISPQQLTNLMSSKSPLNWLSGNISENKTMELYSYLEEDLDIEVITPEKIASKLSEDFLKKQPDKWFIEFYSFLSNRPALWRKGGSQKEGVLRKRPIIKCQDDEIRPPFKKGVGINSETPFVFLPVNTEVDVPIVKWNIFHAEKAKDFLEENLGLINPDICAEVINSVLEKYKNINPNDIETLKKSYLHDVHQINDAYFSSMESRLISELKRCLANISWILSENAKTGIHQFKKSSEVYFTSDELRLFFTDNEDAWFVCENHDLDTKILTDIGVERSPRWKHKQSLILCKKYPSSKIELKDQHIYHRQGLKCFDPDAEVFGLENALDNITPDKSIYIWNEIACKYYKFIRGEIETATRQDFSNAESQTCLSKFGNLLASKSWILTPEGKKSPSECRVCELLPLGFNVGDKIINALQVKPSNQETQQSTINDLKTLLNCPEEIARQISKLPPNELSSMLQNHNQPVVKPAFPERQSKNPERRSRKTREQQERAGNKTYERRTRSVRVSEPPQKPKTYLSDLYTNDDNIMICQMCEREMPFRLSNGKYHFESVQIDDIHPAELHQLKMALCPLCSAKYRFLLKEDDSALKDFLGLLTEENSTLIFPISLAIEGEHSIRFVEIHLEDVKTILENPV